MKKGFEGFLLLVFVTATGFGKQRQKNDSYDSEDRVNLPASSDIPIIAPKSSQGYHRRSIVLPKRWIERVSPQVMKNKIESSPFDRNLVCFWKVNCAKCQKLFNQLRVIQRRIGGKRVRVFHISLDDPDSSVLIRLFAKQHHLKGEIYVPIGGVRDFLKPFINEWPGRVPAILIYGKGGELVQSVKI